MVVTTGFSDQRRLFVETPKYDHEIGRSICVKSANIEDGVKVAEESLPDLKY